MYIEDAPRFGRISGKSAALTASIYFLRFCNFSKIGSIFMRRFYYNSTRKVMEALL